MDKSSENRFEGTGFESFKALGELHENLERLGGIPERMSKYARRRVCAQHKRKLASCGINQLGMGIIWERPFDFEGNPGLLRLAAPKRSEKFLKSLLAE